MKDENLRKLHNFSKKSYNISINTILVIVMVTIIFLLIQKVLYKDDFPKIFGFGLLEVKSGSMSGEFEVGATILIKNVRNENDLKKGDVITFRVSKDTLVTHRIVGISKKNGKLEFETKGDANNTTDDEKVKFENIEGKYIGEIAFIGKLIQLANTPQGMVLFVSIPILLTLYFIILDQKRQKKISARMEKRLKHEVEVLSNYEKEPV